MVMQLGFWRHNKASGGVEALAEKYTNFKGFLPFYAGDKLSDSGIRKSIKEKIPENHKGLVLGNFDEKRTYGLVRPPSRKEDILYWINFWKIFREERPDCKLVNYAMPGLPYWDGKDGYDKKIDYVMNYNAEGIPHWVLWQVIDGASISVYDPYDTNKIKFTGPQIKKRNAAYIKLLEKHFRGRPKVVNFWHRYSNGPDKFKLIPFEELWEEQIVDFIGLNDEYILAAWGILMDNFFRNFKREKELFRKNTEQEHKDAGVDINNASECDAFYKNQFLNLCKKISDKSKLLKG